jgi:hypothetical protein
VAPQVDLNGDGVIDFDEFCQAFSDATSQFKALVTAADGAAPADAAPADAAPEPAAAGGAEKIEVSDGLFGNTTSRDL